MRLQGDQVVALIPTVWQVPAVLQGLFPGLLFSDQNQIMVGTEELHFVLATLRFQAAYFPLCTIVSITWFLICTPKQGLINTKD